MTNKFVQTEKTIGKSKPKWSLIIRIGVTFSILLYLGFKIHWSEIGRQLIHSNPVWLIIAFLLLGIAFLIGGIRWWLLLKVQEIYLPLKVVTALTFIGQFFNSFLLGTTGGDIVKTFYITKYAPTKKAKATLSIILDRVMGLFILLFCALSTLPWQLHFLMKREESKSIVYALSGSFGIIIVVALMLLLIPFQKFPRLFHQTWSKIPRRDILESFLVGFRKHGRSQRLTFEAMAWCAISWLLVFTVGYCIALALHLQVTYIQILTVLSVVICITSLPISIGGHGVREGLFVLMFTIYEIITIDKQTGMGQEPAILFSLVFFALFLGWSLVGGVVYLTFRGSHKSKSPVPSAVSAQGEI